MQQKTNLNLLNVALMFVGAIMGAGFASGREIWQFFGVFGKQGRIAKAIRTVVKAASVNSPKPVFVEII